MRRPDYIPLCTIAGSDPTGGAGLQGDLKTFAAHGVRGTAVVTALTVQGRSGVARVEPVDPDLVGEQIDVVMAEVVPAAWKTGMLWSGPIVRVVAERLAARGSAPLVVDPVLAASAGGDLLRPDALAALAAVLVPEATVITPNLPEGARLLGRVSIPPGEEEEAARALLDLGCGAVVLKGGHGTGPEAVDVLATPEGVRRLVLPRLAGVNAHGTGCAFAAALAARLARGVPLETAAAGAKAYVHRALASAATRARGSILDHAVEA